MQAQANQVHAVAPVDRSAGATPDYFREDTYDLSAAYLDPEVPLEDHRQALAVVQSWFRAAGLDAAEAKLLVDRFNEVVDPYAPPLAAQDTLSGAGESYLRARWGGDFDRNMAQADSAIERLGGAELDLFLKESGLRFDPFVLRTLAGAARRHGWQ
ncbi:MAG: hypothetical protein R3F55_00225 [Alphaproteobacteria bacterium]